MAGDSGRFFVKDSYYTTLQMRSPNPKAFKGKVYLLVGKRSFSAAAHFTILLEAYKRGTIIGEETGGSNAGFNGGDILSIDLPITDMQLELPIEKCMKSIPRYPHKARGVLPHYPITTTIDDLLTGDDKVLKKALELIKKGQ